MLAKTSQSHIFRRIFSEEDGIALTIVSVLLTLIAEGMRFDSYEAFIGHGFGILARQSDQLKVVC